MFIVVDDDRVPMYFHDNPYGDGKCLCNDMPTGFTLFSTRAKARYALTVTRKYAKRDDRLYIDKYWHTDDWKIVKAIKV